MYRLLRNIETDLNYFIFLLNFQTPEIFHNIIEQHFIHLRILCNLQIENYLTAETSHSIPAIN